MMVLTTVSKKQSGNTALVYWRVGINRKGVVEVRLDAGSTDVELIAELAAIRHLIVDCCVFGRTPSSGTGIRLCVSKGAIKKLTKGTSAKGYASRFAALLTSRLFGVDILVSHSMKYMIQEDDEGYAESFSHLDVNTTEYMTPHEVIETPVMGQVAITRHALERYSQRSGIMDSGQTIKRPWASLARRLRNPELLQQSLDANVLAHKYRKYGSDSKVEIWKHPTDLLHFTVVVNPENQRTLVTVFERQKQFF